MVNGPSSLSSAATTPHPPRTDAEPTVARRQRAFAEALGRARADATNLASVDRLGADRAGGDPSGSDRAGDALHAGPGTDAAAAARDAAVGLVAGTLVLPILKALRESNRSAAPFSPGPAERQFRALSDTMVAKQIAGAHRFPLVDRLAQDLLRTPVDPATLATPTAWAVAARAGAQTDTGITR